LNREPGRVEGGDVFLSPALGRPGEDIAKLRYVVTAENAGFDRMNEIAVM
jgi:hypothetical protein